MFAWWGSCVCVCPCVHLSAATGPISIISLFIFVSVCSRTSRVCAHSQFVRNPFLLTLFCTASDCWHLIPINRLLPSSDHQPLQFPSDTPVSPFLYVYVQYVLTLSLWCRLWLKRRWAVTELLTQRVRDDYWYFFLWFSYEICWYLTQAGWSWIFLLSTWAHQEVGAVRNPSQ